MPRPMRATQAGAGVEPASSGVTNGDGEIGRREGEIKTGEAIGQGVADEKIRREERESLNRGTRPGARGGRWLTKEVGFQAFSAE